MIAFIAIALLQVSAEPAQAQASENPAPLTAHCQLIAQGRAQEIRGPSRLTARCQEDVQDSDGLQAIADASLASVNLDLSSRSRQPYSVASSLAFTWSEGGWAPQLGQIIIEREFDIPVINNRPANWMVCAAALSPGVDGTPSNPSARCLSDTEDEQVSERMEQALLEAIADTRFLPSATPYCMGKEYLGYVDIHHPFSGDLWEGGGEMPDPDRLPQLCG
jgi:hypothetical protein